MTNRIHNRFAITTGPAIIRKTIRAILFGLICIPSLTTTSWSQEGSTYEIRSAYIFNFIRYVSWPDHLSKAPYNSMVVCLNASDTDFKTMRDSLDHAGLNDRTIIVRKVRGKEDLPGCWVFYDSPSGEPIDISDDINRDGQGILMIGEYPQPLRQSNIIRFYLTDNRLRFEINPERAKEAGLKISSKLLRLARIVSGGKSRGQQGD